MNKKEVDASLLKPWLLSLCLKLDSTGVPELITFVWVQSYFSLS